MTVNKRNKQYIDDCLSEVKPHYQAEAIRRYIEHLENVISDWQHATGRMHPTLTGVYDAETKRGEGF